MKRLLASVTLLMGALGPVAAPAQDCSAGLEQLGQRTAALETGSAQNAAMPTPTVTQPEIAQLRALRQVAERANQGGNTSACHSIVVEAMAMANAIERPVVAPADELRRADLRNPAGERMGSISELVVDPHSGRVAYGIVEQGGLFGIGADRYPVPWSLFRPADGGEGLVLDVSRDQLAGAPQFTGSDLDMSDRQWAMALHTYYGVVPYWMEPSAALAALLPAEHQAEPQLRQQVQQLSLEVQRLNDELSNARALSGSSQPPGEPKQPQAGPADAGPDAGSNGTTPPASEPNGAVAPTPDR